MIAASGDARGTILRPVEKGAAVEDVGQRIDARQLDELVLQAKQPLSRAQPSVQLLSNWRLSDELVGAAVQRVDEVLLIRVGRHQDDVDRALPARQQPGLPARCGLDRPRRRAQKLRDL
jgi:hypothetical protein